MPSKDLTRWAVTQGDHADDTAYSRVAQNPTAPATDEINAALAAAADVDATQGALEAAAELGVDLTDITGTGASGRITKADVEAAAEN